MGNAFAKGKWAIGKGQKVWREIRHRFPAGGTIVNFAQFLGLGVVPAGTPVVFDDSKYEITAINAVAYDPTAKYAVGDTCVNSNKLYVCKTAIEEAESFTAAHWTEVKSISGYLQDDVVVDTDTFAATGTVVYSGELYAYMYDKTTLPVLKGMSPAEIHFVN